MLLMAPQSVCSMRTLPISLSVSLPLLSLHLITVFVKNIWPAIKKVQCAVDGDEKRRDAIVRRRRQIRDRERESDREEERERVRRGKETETESG